MTVIIKEMHVRTVVERRIIAETEISEDVIRKIENRVVGRLSGYHGLHAGQLQKRKKNER